MRHSDEPLTGNFTTPSLFDCLTSQGFSRGEPGNVTTRRDCPWCGYRLAEGKGWCDETCEELDRRNPE